MLDKVIAKCYNRSLGRQGTVSAKLCDSNKEAAVNEQMLKVEGLSQLLRAVAGRIESDINGLNKELLLQSAEQLDNLEMVAETALEIVCYVPRAGDGVEASKVKRLLLVKLADRLVHASKRAPTLRV